ncbi:MAG: hypothetical protein GPJ54_07395 [Candidatus Heimdallarchaeota archaeon]|nr:hypothetical protein [Candidatus Heimdallarchaeota archaeon]
MPIYSGLLISSKRNFESSASSEIQYTLIEKIGIARNLIKIANTGISGLVSVKIRDTDPIIIVEELSKLELTDAYFLHCLKIKPIQFVIKIKEESNFDELKEIISTKIINDDVTSSYKIQIVKRHSKIQSKELISFIAPMIPNPVDLTNPKWIIQIEIIADNLAISKIKPEHIFRSKLAFDDKSDSSENWFLD